MNDLVIQLSGTDSRCLYQQIYEHIRDEIRKGKLLTGEKLPSTRLLAEYLQVSRSTVDFAYGQLVAEGYVESRPCSGYFVSQVEDVLSLTLEEPVRYGKGKDVPNSASKQKRQKQDADRLCGVSYDFSPHAVSLKDFPFATWKKITRSILVDANSEIFALGDAQGDWELRETISRYLHSSRGVNCRPEQIILGAGNDYLFLLLGKILGDGITAAMEDPTYMRAYQVFASFAGKMCAIPMDGSGMDVELLEKSGATVAYIMPSHQYPTGIVMPIGRRLELLKWAQRAENRFLIEDDYDSEFRYRGKPIPSLQASDRSGRVIYMGTFSKSIAPAIRVGYMVLPETLLGKYYEQCGFYASTVSRIDQRILNEFIREGYFERYLNRMRKIYRNRHDFLLEELTGFQKEFQISGENAGLHILLSSRSGIAEKELLAKAIQAGVRLYGMSKNCVGVKRESTVLIGYGAMEEEELKKGLALLKKAWGEYL